MKTCSWNDLKKLVSLVLLGAMLSVVGEQAALRYTALPRLPDTRILDKRVVRAQMMSAILFGGFRGIVVDLTWIYMEHLWYHARYYKLPALYEFITMVEPNWMDGWIMGGWHMAFNMANTVPPEGKVSPGLRRKLELEWIYKGIRFLKSGAAINGDSYKIHFEIGWTYYLKLKDYKNAISWMEIAETKPDAPAYVGRMVANCYEEMGDLEGAMHTWQRLTETKAYETSKTVRKIIDRRIASLQKKGVTS